MKRIAIKWMVALVIPIFLGQSWLCMKSYAQQGAINQGKILGDGAPTQGQTFENWEQVRVLGYGFILSLSYSPDGSRFAIVGYRAGFIEVRETKSWQIQLQINEPYVRSVAWSPDGRRLVSGSETHLIKIWDSYTGRLLNTLSGHTGWVNSVSWSADGRKLASGSTDRTVRIWDGETGDLIRTISEEDYISTISWSPDNIHVAASSADRTVKIWNSETGELARTLSGHTARVLWVSWSPDGRKLASSDEARTANIWDAESGNLLLTLRHDYPGGATFVYTVAWSPDSRLVGTAVHYHDPAIWIWEAESGKLVRTISIPSRIGNQSAHRLAWSPDSSQIASASSDLRFRIWDPNTGELIEAPSVYTTVGGRNDEHSIRWSPHDTNKLAAPGYDDSLYEEFTRILDVETGVSIHNFSPTEHKLDWSSNGRIASKTAARSIKIWDVETEKLVLTIEETGDGDVYALRLSPDGARIAFGVWYRYDGEIKIREVETGDLLQTIPTLAVASIRWSPDGAQLASIGSIAEDGGFRGIIEIRDAKTGNLVRTIREDRSLLLGPLDWSPDGTRFATGGGRQDRDSWIKIWEVETGKLHRTIENTGRVISLVWSLDNRYIASGTGNQVRIWDAEEGQLLKTFTAHRREVMAVDWSSDGSRIASMSHDGSLRIWGERPKDKLNSDDMKSSHPNDKLPDSKESFFEPLGFSLTENAFTSKRSSIRCAHKRSPLLTELVSARKNSLKSILNVVSFRPR